MLGDQPLDGVAATAGGRRGWGTAGRRARRRVRRARPAGRRRFGVVSGVHGPCGLCRGSGRARRLPRWMSPRVRPVSSETRSPVWHGEQQQGVVAAAEPGGAVGRGQQGVDLGGGQEADDGAVAAFRWDRQYPADHARRVRVRAAPRSGTGSGSRPGGRCGWRRCCLGRSPGGVRNAATSPASRSARSRLLGGVPVVREGELQQQPAGVAVGGDGVRAGPALAHQLVGEEPLQDRREGGHGGPPNAVLEPVRRPGRAAPGRPAGTSRSTSGRRGRARWTAPATGPARRRRRGTSPAGWRRRSHAAGRAAGAGAARRDGDPGRSTRPAKVRERLWASRRVPRVETKKLGALRCGTPPVTALPIAPQRGHGRRVQEQPPRLAELRIQNNQRRGIEVDVVVVEAACFALAHAGHGEQSDQRLPGRRPQRWAQPTGGVDERADLAGRIQMRRDPAPMVRQRVLGRDLAVVVQGLVVAGEDPHRHQPPRQIAVVAAAAASRGRPCSASSLVIRSLPRDSQ